MDGFADRVNVDNETRLFGGKNPRPNKLWPYMQSQLSTLVETSSFAFHLNFFLRFALRQHNGLIS